MACFSKEDFLFPGSDECQRCGAIIGLITPMCIWCGASQLKERKKYKKKRINKKNIRKKI